MILPLSHSLPVASFSYQPEINFTPGNPQSSGPVKCQVDQYSTLVHPAQHRYIIYYTYSPGWKADCSYKFNFWILALTCNRSTKSGFGPQHDT